MKKWNERPLEIRNLFNPAFCGVVLFRAFHGFEEEDNSGMPFSLALLVLPLCLHKDTREILSNNLRRYLLKTISDNPQMRVGFAERTRSLVPYTFEALGFMMQLQSFEVTNEGRIRIRRGIRRQVNETVESIKCQQTARLVGRSFAKIGDRVTIYTTLGIRP